MALCLLLAVMEQFRQLDRRATQEGRWPVHPEFAEFAPREVQMGRSIVFAMLLRPRFWLWPRAGRLRLSQTLPRTRVASLSRTAFVSITWMGVAAAR
jgi:hypothetical protein